MFPKGMGEDLCNFCIMIWKEGSLPSYCPTFIIVGLNVDTIVAISIVTLNHGTKSCEKAWQHNSTEGAKISDDCISPDQTWKTNFHQHICLSIHPFHLFIHPFIWSSIYPSTCSATDRCIHPFIHPSISVSKLRTLTLFTLKYLGRHLPKPKTLLCVITFINIIMSVKLRIIH